MILLRQMAGRRRYARLVALAVVGLYLAGCASYDGPSRTLPASDRALIESTAQNALENNRSGLGSNWSNQETGNTGSVVPLRTFKTASGKNCRDFQQVITVDNVTDVVFDRACRTEQGQWKSVNHRSFADSWPPYRGYDRGYTYYPYRYGWGYPYRGRFYYGPGYPWGYGYYPYYPRYSFGLSFGVGHSF